MINICYLSHSRPQYHKLTFHFLNKIKKENKDKVVLTILATNEYDWDFDLLDGIQTNVVKFNGGDNYMSKIRYAVSQNFEFSIKLDEDCFINNHVFDYMIENANVLNSSDNLLLSPIMSNNIPSCDFFISDFIKDEKIVNEIYNHFLKREMPVGLWGVDYSPLNKHTINASVWDSNQFYDSVKSLNTPVKGIHPIRICYEAQVLINEYVINNVEELLKNNDKELIQINAPYFTNSLFLIKTSEWNKIINNLMVDNYDEIALNNYKNNTNKNFLFIKNGFGMHLMYNTVYGNKNRWGIGGENGDLVEQEYYKKLVEKLIS